MVMMYVCGHIHLHINASYFEMKRFLCFKIFNDDKSNKVHRATCRQLSRNFCTRLALTYTSISQIYTYLLGSLKLK